MANLIPPSARVRVKREYWIRVISVWMMLVGTACLMVATLQAPAYVLVKEQMSVFNHWYKEVEGDSKQFKSLAEVIDRTNEISLMLNKEEEHLLFSDLIKEVEDVATNDIHISDFTISRKEGVVESFNVAGKAASRSSLADFKKDLEASELFESVELPLSNLAKDVDISFNILIVLKSEPEKA